MNAWTVGQQVSLNRNSVVTIDRVTPSGRAFVDDRQYNPDGRERGAGNHRQRGIEVLTPELLKQIWQRGIEVLTPELLKQIALVERYKKARFQMHHAAHKLIEWSNDHCSSYTERVPDLAEIEQIERVASAAAAVLPVAKKAAP